jgi:cobalt-zinc-cadmium efflux system protein
VSLIINIVIVMATWSLLRDSVAMSLQAVPGSIEPKAVRGYLLERPGVAGLHDLHIWPMSTTEIAMTAHLCMPDGHPGDDFLSDTALHLRDRFGIGHMTVQIETSENNACLLVSDATV